MLSFIIAILLHICLADAPAGLYLRGNVQGSLILAVPTLAAIILVLGLALIPSVATKFIGITLAASILAIYCVHASLPTAHALGFIHVRLVAFGLPGAFSFVDCSAEVVWPLRALALLASGVLANALSQRVTIRLASAVPAACIGCLSFEHVLSHLAADLEGAEASLKDARSAAASAKARLAQKEAELAQVKGAFNGIHIHSDVRNNPSLSAVCTHTLLQIVQGALNARIATLEADVVAARQDAAAYFITVRALKHMLKVARSDAQKQDTIKMPRGKPMSSQAYCPSLPKTLMGPMVPQRIEAVKKVLGPGQKNRIEALAVQTSLMSIWNFMTPVQTIVEMRVAIIWPAKVTRGGILT